MAAVLSYVVIFWDSKEIWLQRAEPSDQPEAWVAVHGGFGLDSYSHPYSNHMYLYIVTLIVRDSPYSTLMMACLRFGRGLLFEGQEQTAPFWRACAKTCPLCKCHNRRLELFSGL